MIPGSESWWRYVLNLTIPKSEDNMKSQKEMGHFINWRFGVPVKVHAILQKDQEAVSGEIRLVDEADSYFVIMNKKYGTCVICNKNYYDYELIPHKAGVVSGPRYPVCQSTFNAAYCNADESGMSKLGTHYEQLEPVSIATLNIDGKTIELSAETTAELKKKLGV